MSDVSATAQPTLLMLQYEKFIAFHAIRRGLVCEEFIPTSDQLVALSMALRGGLANEEKVLDIFDEHLISNASGYLFYTPAHQQTITINERFVKPGEALKFDAWMPPMVNWYFKSELYTFAVLDETRSKLSPQTKLYQFPVPNLYPDGKLCYGAANKYDIRKATSSLAYKLVFEILYGVPFTQEAHNRYFYKALVEAYTITDSKKAMEHWRKMLVPDSGARKIQNFL